MSSLRGMGSGGDGWNDKFWKQTYDLDAEAYDQSYPQLIQAFGAILLWHFVYKRGIPREVAVMIVGVWISGYIRCYYRHVRATRAFYWQDHDGVLSRHRRYGPGY